MNHRGPAVAAAVALAACVAPEASAPAVRVLDGDTIELDGRTVRLWGIDAPEMGQECAGASAGAAGVGAASHLGQIIERAPVACVERDRDRYGRSVATCTAAGADVAAEMVRAGWALDWPRYSGGAYGGLENQARADRRGLHALDCAAPWDWRARP